MHNQPVNDVSTHKTGMSLLSLLIAPKTDFVTLIICLYASATYTTCLIQQNFKIYFRKLCNVLAYFNPSWCVYGIRTASSLEQGLTCKWKWTTSKNWQEVASFTFPNNKSLKTKIKITVAKGIVSLFYIASLLDHAK